MVIDGATKQCYKIGHSKNKVSDGVFVELKNILSQKGDFGGVKNHDRNTFITVIIYVYNFHLVLHIFSNCCLIFVIVRSTSISPK